MYCNGIKLLIKFIKRYSRSTCHRTLLTQESVVVIVANALIQSVSVHRAGTWWKPTRFAADVGCERCTYIQYVYMSRYKTTYCKDRRIKKP